MLLGNISSGLGSSMIFAPTRLDHAVAPPWEAYASRAPRDPAHGPAPVGARPQLEASRIAAPPVRPVRPDGDQDAPVDQCRRFVRAPNDPEAARLERLLRLR